MFSRIAFLESSPSGPIFSVHFRHLEVACKPIAQLSRSLIPYENPVLCVAKQTFTKAEGLHIVSIIYLYIPTMLDNIIVLLTQASIAFSYFLPVKFFNEGGEIDFMQTKLSQR